MATFDILKAADTYRQQSDKLRWSGTFEGYLEIVQQNPHVADLSHARVYDMIVSAGVEERESGAGTTAGIKDYKFFDDDIYGLDRH